MAEGVKDRAIISRQEEIMAMREETQGIHHGRAAGAHREDSMTRTIESQTAAIPSVMFLGLAVGSMALSLSLLLAGRREAANFVGQWAPTILIMGLYNKLVKQHGSDRADQQA
jgi:hypothetical protein